MLSDLCPVFTEAFKALNELSIFIIGPGPLSTRLCRGIFFNNYLTLDHLFAVIGRFLGQGMAFVAPLLLPLELNIALSCLLLDIFCFAL